jgi:hypothetical protein
MLLPMRRSQNVGVYLSRLKIGPSQIRPTVLALCNNAAERRGKRVDRAAVALSDEDLEGLRACIPSRDEEVLLKVRVTDGVCFRGLREREEAQNKGVPLCY